MENGSIEYRDENSVVVVAKIENTYYETVAEAINAAEDGETVELLAGTICEQEAALAENAASEDKITIVGAENFATQLTNGIYLGCDDSRNIGHTITVSGIKFTKKGILVAGQKNVIIENNKFENITSCVATKGSSNEDAIVILGKEINATVTGNVINGTEEVGINLRNIASATINDNTISNTQHNSIQIQSAEGGSAEFIVENNTLSDWGKSSEGRAIRIVATNKDVKINGNVMSNDAAPEEFVKVTGFTSLNASQNYWNGVNPLTMDGIFYKTGIDNPEELLLTYYKDAEKSLLLSVDVIGSLTIIDGEANVSNYSYAHEVENLSYKRTLPNAGVWHALYVPFAIPQTELTDYEVVKFTTFDDDKMSLKVEAVEEVEANTPYLIRAKTQETEKELEILLAGIIVKTESNTFEFESSTKNAIIKGVYKETIASEIPGAYAMSGGVLKQAADPNQILKPFRFYVILTDTTNGEAVQSNTLNSIGIDFNGEEGDITTGIDNPESTNDNQEPVIYDLQGRRVVNPTKGIYIVNGKKVVIK